MSDSFGRYRYSFAVILRDILIEHLDGAAVDFRLAEPHSARRKAIMVLLERGFIDAKDRARPSCTTVTEKGRQEMCRLMANWADALLKIGYGDPVDDKSDIPLPYKNPSPGSFEAVRLMSLAYVEMQRLEQGTLDTTHPR